MTVKQRVKRMGIEYRIKRYVERKFQWSGCTEFPTVRQVARALRIKISEVTEIAETGNNLQLTYYNVEGLHQVTQGDWYIETLNPPSNGDR